MAPDYNRLVPGTPTPLHGKKPDGRGQHNVIPISDWRKQGFMEWLCTAPGDREPRTMGGIAEVLQVTIRTLSNWKNDKEFLDAWEKRYLQTIGNPGRKQEIMDTLYKTATDPDDPKHVAAAKQYFEIEGSIKPQKVMMEVTRPAKDLTDDELDSLFAEHISRERQARDESA